MGAVLAVAAVAAVLFLVTLSEDPSAPTVLSAANRVEGFKQAAHDAYSWAAFAFAKPPLKGVEKNAAPVHAHTTALAAAAKAQKAVGSSGGSGGAGKPSGAPGQLANHQVPLGILSCPLVIDHLGSPSLTRS